ncbi:MAG TPA: dTDP-4-keto-6-deoxy-D-glucose epimerase [Candidatus Altiarchaeales archaeon]|nr:dTDP-4-keto-6-deoxy-D-glucose epimerase [Candidatus Altiarchaeales archaeon]
MKIIKVKKLEFPEIKTINFRRFMDDRGYFTETYRKTDFQENQELDFLTGTDFVQHNESYSKKNVIRGLHFQWNPYMGKLVRTIHGHMIDLILDIRKDSPTFGKIIAYDMPSNPEDDYNEWIWVPPGFAHGNIFTIESKIEYLCSGQYSPGCEAGISPLAEDIDWSLCDERLKKVFDEVSQKTKLMTEKDRNGLTLKDWGKKYESEKFKYQDLK